MTYGCLSVKMNKEGRYKTLGHVCYDGSQFYKVCIGYFCYLKH